MHRPHEILNANLMQQGAFVNVFLGAQQLSRPPLIQKLGAENRTLQLNV